MIIMYHSTYFDAFSKAMDRVFNLIFACPAGNRSSPERIIYPDFQSTPLVGNYPQCSLNCAEVIVSGGLSLSHPFGNLRSILDRMSRYPDAHGYSTVATPCNVRKAFCAINRSLTQNGGIKLTRNNSLCSFTYSLLCSSENVFAYGGRSIQSNNIAALAYLDSPMGMPSCEGNCANSFAKSKKARTAAMKRAGSRSSPISSAKSVGYRLWLP